jgi:signal transduction histidine kinase
MTMTDTSPVSPSLLRRVTKYALFVTLAWTAIAAVSLSWNHWQHRVEARALAITFARTSFEKDVIYRTWNSRHGGVYAPVTEETPPNPHLTNIPERDIVTPSGRKLTLINPAYMTRQVFEIGRERGTAYGHITSLDPIRPENAPDQWERRALEAFEKGAVETSSIETMEDREFLRLMRPLRAEENCLPCHGFQGYRVGDVRGGISVSVPMAPLHAVVASTHQSLIVAHGIFWLIGLAGIGLGWSRLSSQIRQRQSAEEAMRRAKEQAEFANSAKTEFLANTSHELRTPLNAIIGFSEVMGAETLGAMGNARYLEYARDISETGKHLLERINDILDVSQIEEGKIVIDDAQIDVPRLVEASVRLLGKRATNAGLTIDSRIQPDLPPLIGDALRVKQILVNLLTNAVKFTPAGGTVSLTVEVDATGCFRFTVTDSGIGIAVGDLDTVFSSFGQLEGHLTRVHDGFGLGLPLARKLTELHGGTLELQSQPGIGTTVSVRFPEWRTKGETI